MFMCLCRADLAGQIGIPAECPRYEMAYRLHTQQKYDSSFTLAQSIAASCLRQGDTLGAVTAMYMQAIPSDHPKRAISIIDSALTYLNAAFRDTVELTLRLLTLRSRKLVDMQRFEEGFLIQAQLESTMQRLNSKGAYWTETIFNNWILRGYQYEDMGAPEMAIRMFRRALASSQAHPGYVPARLVADCHARLSQRFREVDNLVLARQHAHSAMDILRGIPHPDARMKAALLRYRSDYGVILDQAGELDSAAAIFQGILANECKGNPLLYAINQAKLGHVYLRSNRLNEAWNLINASHHYIATTNPLEAAYIRRLNINLAVILMRQGYHDKAILLANRLLAELDSVGVHRGSQYASLQLVLGETKFALGQHAQALQLAHEAGKSTLRFPPPAGHSQNIAPRLVESSDEYLQSLDLSARVHEARFHDSQDLSALARADSDYTVAVEFLAYLDANRIDFSENHYAYERLWIDHRNTLENALRCKKMRYDHTRDPQHLFSAMVITDIARARQIYKSQLFLGDQLRGLVPPQVASMEQLILDSAIYQQRRFREAESPQQKRQADSLASIWSLRHEQFQDHLAQHYPRYHQLKYQNLANLVMTRAALSTPLDRHSAELTYFEGKNSLYAYLRTAQGIQAATIPHKAAVEQLTQTFLQKIDNGSPKDVETIGKRLFSLLLPFSPPPQPISHLLIIPDGFLFRLPFDALALPERLAPGPRAVHLIECADIIEDFSLQAHYLAQATLATMPPARVAHEFVPKQGITFLNAPSGKMVTLKPVASRGELEPLESLLSVKSHTGPAANRHALRRAMTKSAIIHLTTHGEEMEMEDGRKIGFLLLSNNDGSVDLLEISELYGIRQFQNRLFVLNACLTASGRFLPGEGPLSFARSLRQAGCPTVVSMRWYTSSQANSHLFRTFYEQIALGKSPVQALRTAKRTALHNDTDATRRHPKHWCGITIYGGSWRSEAKWIF